MLSTEIHKCAEIVAFLDLEQASNGLDRVQSKIFKCAFETHIKSMRDAYTVLRTSEEVETTTVDKTKDMMRRFIVDRKIFLQVKRAACCDT